MSSRKEKCGNSNPKNSGPLGQTLADKVHIASRESEMRINRLKGRLPPSSGLQETSSLTLALITFMVQIIAVLIYNHYYYD